jgi:hypothetical protein
MNMHSVKSQILKQTGSLATELKVSGVLKKKPDFDIKNYL